MSSSTIKKEWWCHYHLKTNSLFTVFIYCHDEEHQTLQCVALSEILVTLNLFINLEDQNISKNL